jgi:hypothetical protein
MNRWDEPNNLFAPLIAAVPADVEWAWFGNTLDVAADSVPVTSVVYTGKRPNSFRRFREVKHRVVFTVLGDNAKPFSARTTCLDKPIDAPGGGLGYQYWDLVMTNLKRGLCAPAVPADFQAAILECRLMRLTATGQAAAAQMALVRHLWATSVLAASPRAIVFGGQRNWDDSWWPEITSDKPEEIASDEEESE